jgi:capsule biosynthesis phosphatase
MKKLIVDIDNTLTIDSSSKKYDDKVPNIPLILKLKEYKDMGYEIILFSSRNMKTFSGDISKINKITLPVLIDWLDKHNVDYDGLIMGKPWCGELGFYIDDKAIRPDEFLSKSENEIKKIIGL